ncbi:hypothetical protein CJF42_18995 [Pseudoalteromonas sp. NBT06-2]|uniref:DUF3545 family protein n=1 Tax=Pseudoalteromonas sp. NBT06-2 TaxID=2025950 RepID=UPI000BA69F91|nr:DUF3545 family protein [Pseudoalteromonas sp. NBT06-2]PAJ72838.1 hypothetical protein CJF42_18995 [Pseudoalteromonas sp. NBT06-2]
MADTQFLDNLSDLLEDSENTSPERRGRKTKKRKWREIEEIKEKQRLRRELIEYNEFTYEDDIEAVFT